MNWPNSLVDDLASGRCVIFMGSGISANSKNSAGNSPKTWKELLIEGTSKVEDEKRKKTIRSCIKNNDFLMACELLKKALGIDHFNDFLRDEFVTPAFEPAEIHRDIFMLNAPIVLTPNFDKIYDSYVVSSSTGTVSVLQYYSSNIIDCIRKNTPIILKIHGSIDEPQKLVFSKKDYAKIRNENNGFYKLLEALVLTKTFLFVGAGLNDPDIQLLFENYRFQYGQTRKHFFVIPNKSYTEDQLAIYSETMNLEFLKYEVSKRYGHKDLLDSVKNLKNLVDNKLGGSIV